MPNRVIKESTFTSDKIAELSDFEFRLWVGLITQADDYGCGDARPKIIKGRVFALRDRVTLKDIEGALDALAAVGCISLYEVDGKPFFQFPSWAEHQRVRDAKPKFPLPEDGRMLDSLGDIDRDLRRLAATCGEPQNVSADSGLNPIQSNPNPNPIHTNMHTPSAGLAQEFETLWSLYPRKQGKKRAYEAYCRDRKKGITFEQIEKGVKAYAKYVSEERTEEQYIKQGDTFFAQAAWQDDWKPKPKMVGSTGRRLVPEAERDTELPF